LINWRIYYSSFTFNHVFFGQKSWHLLTMFRSNFRLKILKQVLFLKVGSIFQYFSHILPNFLTSILQSRFNNLFLKIYQSLLCMIITRSYYQLEIKTDFFPYIIVLGLQKLLLKSINILYLFVFFFEIGIRNDTF
jgi:hypothetical protein